MPISCRYTDAKPPPLPIKRHTLQKERRNIDLHLWMKSYERGAATVDTIDQRSAHFWLREWGCWNDSFYLDLSEGYGALVYLKFVFVLMVLCKWGRHYWLDTVHCLDVFEARVFLLLLLSVSMLSLPFSLPLPLPLLLSDRGVNWLVVVSF